MDFGHLAKVVRGALLSPGETTRVWRTWRRLVATVAVATVAVATALVVASCGSARATTTNARASKITGRVPAGWARQLVVNPGGVVRFALPPGWALTVSQPLNGAVTQSMVPARSPGTPEADGAPRPGTLYDGEGAGLVAYTPKYPYDVLHPYEIRRSISHMPGVRDYRSTVTAITIATVTEAHVVTESWRTSAGAFDDTILLARTSNGGELVVIAQHQPKTPTVFDPTEIIDSITLQTGR
jgi:hypothetical protein